MTYVAVCLLLLFALLCVSHLVIAYQRIIKRAPGWSAVPLVNVVIGVVGFRLLPDEGLRAVWWLPLLLDWGGVPLLLEFVVHHLVHRGPRQR